MISNEFISVCSDNNSDDGECLLTLRNMDTKETVIDDQGMRSSLKGANNQHGEHRDNLSPAIIVQSSTSIYMNDDNTINKNKLTLNTTNSSTSINSSNLSNNNLVPTAEKRFRPQKYCAVCGDKAIACNFNAVTCESCKAFFRRNAFKEQRLKCLFEGCCTIDCVTRRFCSKCRLSKCFQIGMKREWILTDEQKQIKRVKIQQNKQSKLQLSTDQHSSPASSDDSPSHPQQASIIEPEANNNNNNTLSTHEKLELLGSSSPRNRRRYSSLGGSSTSSSSIGSGINQKVETRDASTSFLDQAELIYMSQSDVRLVHFCSFATQCQYCSIRLASTNNSNEPTSTMMKDTTVDLQLPNEHQENILNRESKVLNNNQTLSNDNHYLSKLGYITWNGETYLRPANTEQEAQERSDTLEFCENERLLIKELNEATKFLFESTKEIELRPDNFHGFVYFCDAALRRLIKTVKQVKAFRMLSMDDQIVLLKAACFKILLLRSAFHYHLHLEGWLDAKTGKIMSLDFLKQAKKSFVYDRHKDLVTKMPEPLRKDRIVLSIMSMVLLFDQTVNLKHKNSVGLDNLIYLNLLRKYLLNTQPDPLTKYESLVATLQIVNACNEEYNVFFSEDFQPGQITPLLVEIFDISINNTM